MKCRPVRSGLTMAEILVVTGLLSLILVFLYGLMSTAITIWHNVAASESALLRLKQAQRRLEADFVETSVQESLVGKTPASLPGGGKDGSVVWFLSAGDETGRLAQKPDGSPFWQRNILYYLVVPSGHTSCTGGVGLHGLDDCCPHKVLVRKVIDVPPPTSPTDDPATTEEVLLTSAEIQRFLTRPNGLSTSAMRAEPNVLQAELIVTDLLWFEVTRPSTGEFHVDLRAVALEEARRNMTIGAQSLGDSRFTVRQPVSIFPSN